MGPKWPQNQKWDQKWPSNLAHFQAWGHFWFILGLGVISGPFLVWVSFQAYFWSGGSLKIHFWLGSHWVILGFGSNFWPILSLGVTFDSFLVWRKLIPNFEFQGQFGPIFSLGFFFDKFWVWGSLWAHFGTGGHCRSILSLEVTLSPFRVWGYFGSISELWVTFSSFSGGYIWPILKLGFTLSQF